MKYQNGQTLYRIHWTSKNGHIVNGHAEKCVLLKWEETKNTLLFYVDNGSSILTLKSWELYETEEFAKAVIKKTLSASFEEIEKESKSMMNKIKKNLKLLED